MCIIRAWHFYFLQGEALPICSLVDEQGFYKVPPSPSFKCDQIWIERLLFCQNPSPRFCVSVATMTHSQLKQGREQLLLNPSTASGAIYAREVGTMHSSQPGPWQGLRVNGLAGNSFNPHFEAYLPVTGLHTWSLSEAIPQSHEQQYPFRNQYLLLAHWNPRLPWDEGTQQHSTSSPLPCTTLLFLAAQQSQLEGKRLFADWFLERLCFLHWKHVGEVCKDRQLTNLT